MADETDDSAKLALLAHDLRTPLAAMRITAELIGNGPLDAAQCEQLGILVRSIDALAEMTGELVEASRPEPGAPAPRLPVADIVIQTVELFRNAAAEKGLTLEVSVDEDAERAVTTSAGAVRRVLGTLLDNAIKYTELGGITVELVPDTDAQVSRKTSPAFRAVRIGVTDTGPGIAKEEQARLFRPFARGSAGRGHVGGTGLGLWGAARTLNGFGGRLSLSRVAEGGSRFEMWIPTADFDLSEQPFEQTEVESQLDAAHVLIVDDNDTNCRLLSALLESFGVSSDQANCGRDALALAQDHRYDAVLMDLHMPEMDGVATARALRTFKSAEDMPLIAVTAAVETLDGETGNRALFEDVLAKPLSPAALYEAMEKVRKVRGEGRSTAEA